MNKFCTYHLLSTNQRINRCLDLNKYALSLHGSNYSLDYMHHPLSLTPVRFFGYRNLFDVQEPRIVHKISPTNQNNKSCSEFTPLKTNSMEPKQGPLEKKQHLQTINFLGSMLVLRAPLFQKGDFFGTSIAQCISITPSSVAFGNPDFGARKGLRCWKATGKSGVLALGYITGRQHVHFTWCNWKTNQFQTRPAMVGSFVTIRYWCSPFFESKFFGYPILFLFGCCVFFSH